MTDNLINDPVDNLFEFLDSASGRKNNEAETRHKLIDTIIHDILSWPKNRVSVERHVNNGYSDYLLSNQGGDPVFLIEAKREGVYFQLPPRKPGEKQFFYMRLDRLCSDDNIEKAVLQAREYCLDLGCEFASITNGHEWVLFKPFQKGKNWKKLQALVIRSPEYFRDCNTHAMQNLSFTGIVENSSLHTILSTGAPKDRPMFYPKENIQAYSHTIRANKLAAALRPIINNYFGVIEDADKDFMNKCYVAERDYEDATKGMESLIHDSLTPYFAEYGVNQLDDSGKGGAIGGRLRKNIKEKKGGEVLILFGGKGSGKSTFIKRLLHHHPPRWLSDSALTVVVDLLNTPEDKTIVYTQIWHKLVEGLDQDHLLTQGREQLLSGLFSHKYSIALKQQLAGLDRKGPDFNLKLNDLLQTWLKDYEYCAHMLVEYWATKNKGVIVVVDNTDQYSGELQEFCFTSAQYISKKLNCVTIISMREERFHNSKIHGTLDAFQNSGFHISSPRPSQVFLKRINYTIEVLKNPAKRAMFSIADDQQLIDDCCQYLEIVGKGFRYTSSHLNKFLTACGHGDIRLSLSLFRSFLLSGYTNVDEMLIAGQWNFQPHQVIKPVMIPSRYFYDESESDIPNIFKPRNKRLSSHFTSLRVLRKLEKGSEADNYHFTDVSELKTYFAETFQMVDDLIENLDVLLKHGFLESDNRLDYYSEEVSRVRLTNYGKYMFSKMAFFFTYLDLVSLDCGIFDEKIANYQAIAAKDEYKLFTQRKREERVKLRLDRVENFIEYLKVEEAKEIEHYKLSFPDKDRFSSLLSESFIKERRSIEASAFKNSMKRSDTRKFR